jgi:hypothetical protein
MFPQWHLPWISMRALSDIAAFNAAHNRAETAAR